jgi:hypothetical protein
MSIYIIEKELSKLSELYIPDVYEPLNCLALILNDSSQSITGYITNTGYLYKFIKSVIVQDFDTWCTIKSNFPIVKMRNYNYNEDISIPIKKLVSSDLLLACLEYNELNNFKKNYNLIIDSKNLIGICIDKQCSKKQIDDIFSKIQINKDFWKIYIKHPEILYKLSINKLEFVKNNIGLLNPEKKDKKYKKIQLFITQMQKEKKK